jgi:hypothetical protein
MKPKMESNTASLGVFGVDIGKEVFSNSYRPASLGWKHV